MVVLFRVVNRQVERVRVFSEDCQLDAGGREVTWLTGVRPAESVALLESLVTAQPGTDRRDRVLDGAITAIALHEDTAADASLERLLATSQPQSVREKVPFWLGQQPRPARARDSAARHQGRSLAGGQEEGGVRPLAEQGSRAPWTS